MSYNHREIEAKWQKYWDKKKTFKASNTSDKPKFYVLDMFPYPSGAGLHVGHPLGYIASDIYARYKRHKGFNVLHPQGYDSFGLPAEQYAIQTGQHPAKTTEENIKTYRRQLDRIGFSFDWSREVRTSSPEYYKWTQWIFTKLFNAWYNKDTDKAEDIKTLIATFKKSGNAEVNAVCDDEIPVFTAKEWKAYSAKEQEQILAKYRLTYLSETEVNWCPELGTVLANDEIVNGVSERGGHPVVRKKMMQWSMRISAYAQRLLDGLEKIDWPQPLKDSQTNWIGRSQGAMVKFKVKISNIEKGSRDVNLSYKEVENIKEMRLNLSKAEELLWGKLKAKKGAAKFRQKYTLGNYMADFVCFAKNTVVEFVAKQDEQVRADFFEKEGFSVVYVSNDEIIENVDAVVGKINNVMQFPTVGKAKKEAKKEVLTETEHEIQVFTTRPDTVFGVSFMTLAPEHELVSKIVTDEQKSAVEAYIKATAKRSERERMADVKTISGVFTGAYATHPFTGEKVQIWIGDYVLASYGTGAVMAVPCGDERDYAFAKHFGIEIPNIFEGVDISEEAFADKEKTILANSDFLNGLNYKKGMKTIIYELEKRGIGYGKINYRLRDAVFSRQRYWGEPFPVYYKDGMPQMIDVKHLPIVLPEVEKYLPTSDGKPPLGNAEVWAWDARNNKIVSNEMLKQVQHDEDGRHSELDSESHPEIYPMELNTMPGWAGSSWYFNRYMDPTNSKKFASKKALDYWQDVDLYIGGSEHATGHLLYARFWQKFLFDLDLVPVDEFAKKLINQGMITGTSAFVYGFGVGIKNLRSIKEHFPQRFVIPKVSYEKAIKGDYDEVIMEIVESELKKYRDSGNPDVEWNLEMTALVPMHVDVSFVNSSDELDIDAFKNWREEFSDLIFIKNKEGKYICGREVEKMSKSKYNVVNPDNICEEYGADSLRLFEMFLGPLEQSKPWNTAGISGSYSFLKKLWKLYHSGEDGAFYVDSSPLGKSDGAALKTLHKTIKKVDDDITNFSFNTSVSSFMIAVNELQGFKCNKREILEPLIVLISPYAPHIAEELWSKLGHKTSISTAEFPVFEPKHLVESSKNYPISFNGKMRFTLELPLDMSKEDIEKTVMAHEKTQEQLQGRTPKKVIVVPGKIVNIVG
ncbi:class I tRNA ligase family protein [Urechidicola croceus]|uniref:Leucine--tRNA ligase n=1 Tax=Urechidicola croceus TaxID=1850246 RepID=A0A1D8P8L7_9FLAO|nr:class I tRNA ligase family protein [Urechidicola croceus]AOW20903.1 leucine--tRNA ligase [Urechidicola croceus]